VHLAAGGPATSELPKKGHPAISPVFRKTPTYKIALEHHMHPRQQSTMRFIFRSLRYVNYPERINEDSCLANENMKILTGVTGLLAYWFWGRTWKCGFRHREENFGVGEIGVMVPHVN
jgi:hypothetical protein